MLCNDRAQFDLARRLQLKAVPLSEVFSFLSGLYFRGKVAYSRAFANPPPGLTGAYVITTNKGLVPMDTPVTLKELREFSEVDINGEDDRYRKPALRDARRILKGAGDCEVVLLGSIATGKYVDLLIEVFNDRLLFPEEFVGRGDMSRGGLMLRSASDGLELKYIPVKGSIRHGKRPARLAPRKSS